MRTNNKELLDEPIFFNYDIGDSRFTASLFHLHNNS
jgi:hypothetical protein